MNTQETIALAAPQLIVPPAAANKWRRELEAFQRLLPDLLRTHAGQYVVIHDGQVVDSGADDLDIKQACQEAIGQAWGEYLVLLNNDTIVTHAWLNQLLGLLNKAPGISLVTP